MYASDSLARHACFRKNGRYALLVMGPIHRAAVLLLLLARALAGQRYSFKEYGQDQGLTNLDVFCLLQDRTGFLWVGTEDGLFRYDGRQFRAYTKAQGLP